MSVQNIGQMRMQCDHSLMSVTVTDLKSFDTANCDTCVVRTLYGISFFFVIIFAISKNSSLLLAAFLVSFC